MASGLKEGPPPGRLWIIKSGYEIRYYTTPETLAQAIVDGYQGEIAVYKLAEDATIVADVEDAMRPDPADPEPGEPVVLQQVHAAQMAGTRSWFDPLTPAEQIVFKKWEKDRRAWRKRLRAKVVEVLLR